jgi:hypothetical protein
MIVTYLIIPSLNRLTPDWISVLTGLQINLYLEQPMEIQLFATFLQRRK